MPAITADEILEDLQKAVNTLTENEWKEPQKLEDAVFLLPTYLHTRTFLCEACNIIAWEKVCPSCGREIPRVDKVLAPT